MPQIEAHLRAADVNEELAVELLGRPSSIAWSPVLAFYSALHMIDAFLATADIHPMSHVSRRNAIRQMILLSPIEEDYRMLEVISRQARYDLRQFTLDEARELLEGELHRITTAVRALLAQRGP